MHRQQIILGLDILDSHHADFAKHKYNVRLFEMKCHELPKN